MVKESDYSHLVRLKKEHLQKKISKKVSSITPTRIDTKDSLTQRSNIQVLADSTFQQETSGKENSRMEICTEMEISIIERANTTMCLETLERRMEKE